MLSQFRYTRCFVLGLAMWTGCVGHIVTSGDGETSGRNPTEAMPEDDDLITDAGASVSDASEPARPEPVVDSGAARPEPADDGGDRVDASTDKFGVRMLYPTAPKARTWTLPDDAEQPSSEWNVEREQVTRVSAGVFHTLGSDGEVRLGVGSPAGKSWWRNVEITGYFRYTEAHDSNGQLRHWELLARGERHAQAKIMGSAINGGSAAPAGSATWPGYPFAGTAVNAQCLGSSYHGNFYPEGRGLFEKELSHSAGYASQRAPSTMKAFPDPTMRWFGLKLVVRNADNNKRVHLELWIDAMANGDWKMLTETDDVPGAWSASNGELDGCAAPPFSFSRDQLLTWAGPWVIFRSDSLGMDFRWLSVREISPLP